MSPLLKNQAPHFLEQESQRKKNKEEEGGGGGVKSLGRGQK
jgi:hypothetical protein